MSIYITRSLFDVAHDEATGFRVCGIWYRHNPIEYRVLNDIRPGCISFNTVAEALAHFEAKVEEAKVEEAKAITS